jgi:glycosyltransferase involved in cell wall biosynthesis
MKPRVSVIVPCRNEARFIERSVGSIFGNDYPAERLEVIVADGGSVDGTGAILGRLAALHRRLRIIDNPEQTTPFALNRAIAVAQGEIVIRFDAHAVMPPDYIGRCVDLLLSSHADNAGGAIRTVAQTSGPFSQAIVWALSSRFGVGNSGFRTRSRDRGARPADTVFGGCWRRELFARIGGFNERLTRSQDIEFNLRIAQAGGTIVLDPEIVCDYYARADLRSFITHNFANGVWAVMPFAFSEVVPVRPRHLIPLLFVASLAISAWLPFPWSIGVCSAYALVNVAASAQIALARRSVSALALLPLAFAGLHFAYGIGSAWGGIQLAARKLRSTPAFHLEDRKI